MSAMFVTGTVSTPTGDMDGHLVTPGEARQS
jgi:hypothetical protein